jgi:hypothetical protein
MTGLDSQTTNGANSTSDTHRQPEHPGSPSAASQTSTAISSAGGRRMNVLQIHRRKLEILAAAIHEELARTGFEMPDDPGDRFF